MRIPPHEISNSAQCISFIAPLSLSSGQESLFVNGFKLNLGSMSSRFLADIGSFKDIRDNHINDFDNMSEKQMQLLEQRSALDVIEIS